MDDLIRIEIAEIGDQEINSVNARELWEFLGSKQRFTDWITNRIAKYGFVDGTDYCSFHKIMKTGDVNVAKPMTEYIISIDMAKELAMVENNEKGRQARRYFIEIEKRYKTQTIPRLSRKQILELALESENNYLAEKKKTRLLENNINEKNKIIEHNEKYVDFAKQIKSTPAETDFEKFAKSLGTGRNRVYRWLRECKVLRQNNIPYQKYIDAGYFTVSVKSIIDHGNNKRLVYSTRITSRGQIQIAGWLLKKGLIKRRV